MTTSPETLEAIIKAQKFQAGAYAKVVELARQYALMNTTGCYMENGNTITVNFSSRKDMEKMFADNLLRACVRAFIEDALVGAELQNAK